MIGDRLLQTNKPIPGFGHSTYVSVKCICLAMQYYTVVDVANVLNMGMFVETLQ